MSGIHRNGFVPTWNEPPRAPSAPRNADLQALFLSPVLQQLCQAPLADFVSLAFPSVVSRLQRLQGSFRTSIPALTGRTISSPPLRGLPT
jgi:hypothetical protein